VGGKNGGGRATAMTHRAALSARSRAGVAPPTHWFFFHFFFETGFSPPLDGTRESALPPFSSAQTLSGEDYSSRASLQYC